jgi:hypothetical protein
MKSALHPWQMLPLILVGWINQQQQHAIEYLIAENRILREKIGKKRISFTDNQRRRLAVKGTGTEVRRDLKFLLWTGSFTLADSLPICLPIQVEKDGKMRKICIRTA